MSINWDLMKRDIQQYMDEGKSDSSRTHLEVAFQLENLYVRNVIGNGVDMYGNHVVDIQRGMLSTTLTTAFEFNMNYPGPLGLVKLNALGLNGIILSWMGSTMSTTAFPPGFAVVLGNKVTFGGSPATMNLLEIGTVDFAEEMINALRIHAKTISGVVVGQTPVGNPISLPWVGIL